MQPDERTHALVEEFAARRARGERPDVDEYLTRAGDDAEWARALLLAVIEGAEPPEPPPALVAAMGALVDEDAPMLALRHHRRLTLDALAARLVELLGLPDPSVARVRALYQRLEGGLIDVASIAGPLRAAIAQALAVKDADLMIARGRSEEHVFARGPEGWQQMVDDLPEAPLPGPPSPEVDRLFGLP